MKSNKKMDSAFNLAQQVQLIILLLILAAVSAVLVSIYAYSAESSRDSHRLSDAVQISRNIAEEYSGLKSLSALCGNDDSSLESDSAVIYYSGGLEATQAESALYLARLSEIKANRLNTLAVSVCSLDNEKEIYSLTVSVYSGG